MMQLVRHFLLNTIIIEFRLFFYHFARKIRHISKVCLFQEFKAYIFFDSDLRNLITKMIESIEMYCRTKFARQFTDAYGALGYMNGANYASMLALLNSP